MKTPFKFLDAYSKEDKAIFFGREKETDDLYLKVFRTNLVLLYGPSGAGKTSLINCGLANRFADTDWFQLSIRRQKNHPQSIRQVLWHALEESQKFQRKKSKLPSPDAPVSTLIHEIYIRHFKPIYLIFDQFEELFILGDEEEKAAVVQILKEIVESEGNCTLLLVMREEYLAELDYFEELIPHIRDNRLRVETMGRGKVRNVVKSILEVPGFKINLEEAETTKNKIVENIHNNGDIHLAYLQVYLDRLYEKARQKNPDNIVFSPQLVEETGKLEDVLGLFLSEQLALIHQHLSAKHSNLSIEDLWQFLSAFVTVKGTKVPITYDQLAQRYPQYEADFMKECLQQLYTRRILRDEDGIYEIAHDSLASHIAENIGHETRKLREAELLIEDRHSAWKLTGALLNKKELDYLAFFEDRLQLAPEMQEFLSRSRKVAQKRRRQLISGIALGVLIIGLTIFALFNAWKVERINGSLSLVSKAQSVIETDPTQALGFAWEAAQSNKNPISEAVLYETFREYNFYEDILKQPDQISTLAISPDEQYIAFSKTGMSGNRVLYLANDEGNILDSLITEDDINSIAFSPDGKQLFLGADDARAYLWSFEEKKSVSIPHEDPKIQGNINVTAIAYASNGNFLATGTETGQIFIYEVEKVLNGNSEPFYQSDTLDNSIQTLAFSEETEELFVGTIAGEVVWLDIDANSMFTTHILDHPVAAFHQFGDSTLGIICGERIFQWEPYGDTIIHFSSKHEIVLSDPSIISSNGKNILTAEDGNKLKWWDIDGTSKGLFIGHQKDIDNIVFANDGNRFYSSSSDGNIKKWTLPYFSKLLSESSSFGVSALKLSAEDSILIGRLSLEKIDMDGMSGTAFRPEADRILDISPSTSSVIWEFNAQLIWGNMSRTSPLTFEHTSSIRKALISPDGSRVLGAYYEGEVILWDTVGNIIQEINEAGGVNALAFSEDGKYFALGGSDGKLSLWDAQKLSQVLDYEHVDVVKVCSISPDNKFVISADESGYLKSFDINSRKTEEWHKSTSQILDIAISDDSQWIAIAKEDGSLQIWDRNGNLYHEIAINDTGISKILFADDAQVLILGQEDGKVIRLEILKTL